MARLAPAVSHIIASQPPAAPTTGPMISAIPMPSGQLVTSKAMAVTRRSSRNQSATMPASRTLTVTPPIPATILPAVASAIPSDMAVIAPPAAMISRPVNATCFSP